MGYELVIVGAGLAGIKAANKAIANGYKNILVVEHSDKIGGYFSGVIDLKDFKTERKLVNEFKENVESSKIELSLNSTLIGIFSMNEDHYLTINTKERTEEIVTSKLFLCTGSLLKPREAHKVPGSRPSGVMTSQMAIELLRRNLIPGKEIVLFDKDKVTEVMSTILSHNGSNVMTLDSNSYELKRINGTPRIKSIDVYNLKFNRAERYECDTLIYSKEEIPSTFYLEGHEIEQDSQGFIEVDHKGQTNIKNIFAFGNCTDKKV